MVDGAQAVGCALVALSEYTAVGASEVSLREGQHAELLKVGCAGWWYVRLAGTYSPPLSVCRIFVFLC